MIELDEEVIIEHFRESTVALAPLEILTKESALILCLQNLIGNRIL